MFVYKIQSVPITQMRGMQLISALFVKYCPNTTLLDHQLAGNEAKIERTALYKIIWVRLLAVRQLLENLLTYMILIGQV
jgi:hypothetical protein